MKAPHQVRAAVAALALFTACGETTSPAIQLARMELRSNTRAIAVGYFTTIEAVAYDQHNATMATPVVSWSSDDPTIATVDARGVATGQGIGDVTIRASSGVFEAQLRILVKPSRIVVRTHIGSSDLVPGESVILTSEVLDATGKRIEKHPPLTWVTWDEGIVRLEPAPEFGPSFAKVTGRSTGLAPISVGVEGMETSIIIGVVPELVTNTPVRVSDFYFFRLWDEFASYIPTMQVEVAAGRSVTMTRLEIALPATIPKGLPPLCSNGRLSAGSHGLLGATSYPLPALYNYSFIDVFDHYGAALLTYRTDNGREIHTIVRGPIDPWTLNGGYVTYFPWQLCTA